MMEDLDALPLLVLIQRATLRMMAVSTAPAPVPMKRTGINLEKFREKKKYILHRAGFEPEHTSLQAEY